MTPTLPIAAMMPKTMRERLAKETRRGVVEKPGAYYQSVLIKLLETHQVFVPTAGEDDPEEVRRLVWESLGLPEEKRLKTE